MKVRSNRLIIDSDDDGSTKDDPWKLGITKGDRMFHAGSAIGFRLSIPSQKPINRQFTGQVIDDDDQEESDHNDSDAAQDSDSVGEDKDTASDNDKDGKTPMAEDDTHYGGDFQQDVIEIVGLADVDYTNVVSQNLEGQGDAMEDMDSGFVAPSDVVDYVGSAEDGGHSHGKEARDSGFDGAPSEVVEYGVIAEDGGRSHAMDQEGGNESGLTSSDIEYDSWELKTRR